MYMRALLLSSVFLVACSAADAKTGDTQMITGSDGVTLKATHLSTFDSPWAMAFLPDGRALVSEKDGALWLLGKDDPKDNKFSGAVVDRATLTLTATGGSLSERSQVWEQLPKMTGNGHYGHRIGVSPDNYLFISSGERQHFTPSQNMDMNLGKVVRLNRDGSVPDDNPFAKQGGVRTGDAFIGGLSSEALIRVDMDADGGPKEAARYEWEERIREVETGPNGALYVLEDAEGRLLKLEPAK